MNPGPGRLAVSQPSSTFNSTATYSCQSVGYNIDGDIQRTCGADGSYSGSEPTCTREYIYISRGQEEYYHNSIQCEVNVIDTLPTFFIVMHTVVTCPMISISPPLMLDQPNRNYNTMATFSCQTGYNLVGDAQRTCQADGTYSGATPNCSSELIVFDVNMYDGGVNLCDCLLLCQL